MLAELLRTLGALARLSLGVLAAVLPRRRWAALERWAPAATCAVASGILTMGIAFAIGVPGFLRHAGYNADHAADVRLQAARWTQPAGAQAPSAAVDLGVWGSAYLSVFSFFLLTPTGWLTAYLGVTGLVRSVAAYVDDPRGDPLLTLIDGVCGTTARGARTWHRRKRREHAEGPEVPDRLVTGIAGGFPEADWVVVASRRKPDWTAGTFVITSDRWYTLGTPEERQTPAGLRTLYPLAELRTHEVLRRGVRYELPERPAQD